ncbi:MAG: hypothetical protein CL946_00255 [Ectothiorhodospiraceae bacterium]|nr:hypothetical protein [Ectothiorhodospiraceae bacterium]
MEDIVSFVTSLDPNYIYLAVFLISYIENVFPPFPSDVIIVFAGSLIGMGENSAAITLALGTAGSTLGFMTMYYIGASFGKKVIGGGKIKFISPEMLNTVDRWFSKYGYSVIIANRFLAGTRAVVSFFAGMAKMSLWKTTVLSLLSALAWHSILVYAGVKLGENWREISGLLQNYSIAVTIIITVVIVGYLLGKYVIFKKSEKEES